MNKLEIKTVIVGALGTNCYLVWNKESKNCIIVDPGAEADKISENIEKQGLNAEAIYVTHYHSDHTGVLRRIKEKYNIPIYGNGTYAEDFPRDFSKKDGEVWNCIGVDWKLIHTPGHAPGACCYYAEDENLLISGDTLFRGTYGRTDFEDGSFQDIKDSLKNKLFILPDDTMVFPGHGWPTSIGKEKDSNPINI